ncbi:branched-chain amino acid ABC transporter permease [Pseudactinotalea suaedae]|uniref:branched-chain amino acid ABC transporter permease n=1 Tax=Pseudactinotalea suaedae TaxID=1524924 RepID=UPI0012E17575|nr:branched-chain amino acid ABC transporter permease [Pseudactinotalea suaedae]
MHFQYVFDNFASLFIGGLVFGSVYALIALGYTMVYGVLQLINFAHSEVFMFGTFATVWALWLIGADATTMGVALVLSIAFAMVASMITSGGVALLLERVAYRPLLKRGAPRLIALISAIGASFVLSEAMGLRGAIASALGLSDTLGRYVARSRENLGMPTDRTTTVQFELFGYGVTNVNIIVVVSAVLMMVAADQFIRRTRTGRGIRAVAQDPETASLMGVNSTRVIQITFLIGGMLAGAAATLYMLHIGATRYNAGFLLGVKAFTAAVLGGIGNLRGALVGGLVLGVAEGLGAGLFGNEWRHVVAFVLLILILLFRPTGLLGESLGKARA